jgi:taurine dioxygenase
MSSVAEERVVARRLTSHIGAELTGFSLTDFDEDTFAVLHAALLEHHVVFVPGQFLGPADLLEIARWFGPIYPNPTSPKADGYPDVTELVTYDGRSPDIVHFDTSYVEVPPTASLMTIVKSPPIGGDTLWSSGYALYESLSDAMRDFVEGLSVRYEARLSDGGRLVGEHPIVRVHPETRRPTLYFDSQWSKAVVQLSKEESDAMLGFLRAYVKDPTFQCRYRWTEGTFAMWDNRCTPHRVASDFVGERIIQRVTVAGERPVGARGQVSTGDSDEMTRGRT